MNYAWLAILHDHIPILVKFLHIATKGGLERLSSIISDQLTRIMEVCQATYSKLHVPPPPSSYIPPADSFFPQLPILTSRGSNQSDFFRKASYGHLSFSPGIFTVFRPHGIWCRAMSHPCINLAFSANTSMLHLMLLSTIMHLNCINTVWSGSHTSFRMFSL